MINITTINNYLKEILDPDNITDYAINGIQVECDGIIKKAGFAVDASISSIKKAIENNCNLLIVHHGFFWGSPLAITGTHKKRLELLLKNNIGLVAYHLPLDRHQELGNNACILKQIGINELIPFGYSKGKAIGFRGELNKALNIERIIEKLNFPKESINYLDFGNKDIKKIAVMSGTGGRYFSEAIENEIDLYITGDSDHILYYTAQENKINILFGGHYQTEIQGINALKNELEKKFQLETCFFDLPTGL